MLNLKKSPEGIGLLGWNTELPASGIDDPLGMTLRVGARLAAELMHCITSVTPRARYYSFYPWAFERTYGRLGKAGTLAGAMQMVLLDERAMTLGAVLHHEGRTCDGGALQGSTEAIHFARSPSGESLDLRSWSHLADNASGFAPYKGSLVNLGLFEDGEVGEEGEEAGTLRSGRLSSKGRRLAEAFGRAVANTRFVHLKPEDSAVPLDVLKEFGAAAGLCELMSADDCDLRPLRDLFFATDLEDENNSHHRRRMSLMLLLWAVDTARTAGRDLDARTFDDLTFYGVVLDENDDASSVEVPGPLADIAQRWRIFHFHNYLTTALESLLSGLVRSLRYHPAGRSISEVLEAFDSDEANTELAEYFKFESDVRFMELTPIDALALIGIDAESWRSRSSTGGKMMFGDALIERSLRTSLVDDGLVSGTIGPALSILLLLVLMLRFEHTVAEAYQGWNRAKAYQPLSDISMPTLAQALVMELGSNWWTRPLRDVVARVMTRFVVRQHETMSYEKGYGGSPPLFRVDGVMIVGMDLVLDNVGAGNPRFGSAMRVLRDLRLIANDAEEGLILTAEGRGLLETLLETARS